MQLNNSLSQSITVRLSLHTFSMTLQLQKSHKNSAIENVTFSLPVKGDNCQSRKLALFLSACDTVRRRQPVCISFCWAWRRSRGTRTKERGRKVQKCVYDLMTEKQNAWCSETKKSCCARAVIALLPRKFKWAYADKQHLSSHTLISSAKRSLSLCDFGKNGADGCLRLCRTQSHNFLCCDLFDSLSLTLYLCLCSSCSALSQAPDHQGNPCLSPRPA